MKTTKDKLVPKMDQPQYKEIAGFKIDLVKDEAEDFVLDLVDEVASDEKLKAEKIVTEIARRAERRPEFRDAALQTMNYLLGAYSKPDYRFRPDLNHAVGLHHVNSADEMLRKALR